MELRFLNFSIACIFSTELYYSAVSIMYTFTLALVAKFRPNKCKRSNTADVVILLATITAYTSSIMRSLETFLFPKWLRGAIIVVAILIIYCYIGSLVLTTIFSRFQGCFTVGKSFRLLKYICKCNVKNAEDQPLLT